MTLNEKDYLVLQFLVNNDTAMGCYALDIEAALNLRTGVSGPSLSILARSGLAEKRFQDEAPWPVSGREAPIVPGEYPRRVYYRALPRGRIALAEHAQAQASQSGWGVLPNPATA